MNTLRSFLYVVAALGAIAVPGCSSDDSGPDATLHVQNDSNFSIVDIRVAPVGTSSWGPNLVSDNALDPGETLPIDVSCGTYDARLIDESGVPCELSSVDLCLSDTDWVIRDNTCTVFGAAKAAREAAAKANAGSASTGSANAPDAAAH